jgi:hypothetical protein
MPTASPAIEAATDTLEQPAAPAAGAPTRRARFRWNRRWRIAGVLVPVLRSSYYLDPLFERPDLVEDDYYRFLNQPRG